MPTACVVVPTKDEGPGIADVIRGIKEAFKVIEYEKVVILVVDDSKDNTKKVAEDAGAIIMRGHGDGLGSAMFMGLKAALEWNPDVILSVDGDGQADPSEIPRFLEPIESKEADLVLGSRFAESGLVRYNYRWRNRMGIRLLAWILRSYTGLPLTDSHGGIRAMTPEVAADLDMIGTHTYVQETIIDAAEKGYRIREIPSVWRSREVGKSKVVGSIPKYIAYTLPVLLIRSGSHIRWLYTSGLILIALGFLTFFVVIWQEDFNIAQMGARTPAFVLITLLVSTGVQLFFFGYILQALKQMNKTLGRLRQSYSARRNLD